MRADMIAIMPIPAGPMSFIIQKGLEVIFEGYPMDPRSISILRRRPLWSVLHESGERLHLKEQLLVGEANFLFADNLGVSGRARIKMHSAPISG